MGKDFGRIEGAPRLQPILLVEDNPMDLDLTIKAIKEQGISNPILTCRDGEEALEFIGRHNTPEDPDLPLIVLLDLRLPMVDGIEVLRHARQHPIWKQIPFIVLTTSRENSDIRRAYELGVNSYIIKPVDFLKFSELTKVLHLYWILTNQPPFPGKG